MSGSDAKTLAFYHDEAEAYATRPSRGETSDRRRLWTFLSALPQGAAILELGCGGGQDSEAMLTAGFDVTPTDGSVEIARQAEKRLGRPVGVLLFSDLCSVDSYDGVWANACLLHVPRDDLPGIIGRVHAALRPGGVFHASFKAGEAEGRDRFDRYYNYPSAEWLREAYDPARWAAIDIAEWDGGGYDGVATAWLCVTATKRR
jgi:SAM-dependent methyltransferase